MRPLNRLNTVKASVEGDYETLPAGAYACRITDIVDNEQREYVDLIFDICVGEHEGYFSDDFYSDKPWAHHMILSYKSDQALSMTKGRLETISACNTGFDAVAAFDSGNPILLKDKAVGVVFRCEEYYDKKEDVFKVGASPRPYRLCTTQEVQDGKLSDPKPYILKDDRKRDALERAGIDPDRWLAQRGGDWYGKPGAVVAAQPMPANVYDEDVPF